MKIGRSSGILCLAVAALLLPFAPSALSQTGKPLITNVRPKGTNVLVTVQFPAGVHRIVIESRARFGSGAWAPVAVAQTDDTAASISILVPCSRATELLRARADSQLPLPSAFYRGTNKFAGPSTNTAIGLYGGLADANGGGPRTDPGTTGADPRAVVESDIWQIKGDALYFFNQYRGLQIIDIKDPNQSKILGTLPLPAAGEQMYVLDTTHVVLLARSSCYSGYDQSAVMVVDVSAPNAPRVVSSLTLNGYISESRMVGTALYVASQAYRLAPSKTNTVWEWGTQVSSFDLAKPDAPVARDTLWYSGYGNVVAATDTYFFVVTLNSANWWQSTVSVIDITSPDGKMSPYDSVTAAGQIADKFKIQYSDNVLTLISEDWRRLNNTPMVTRLETFRLPDPRTLPPAGILKLGQLELGRGERLHATRFDGSRVYVVTFFQIDPLWVVDLSDPTQPKIVGSVEVPGWSTYIQPLGNRLLAVGVETNRVAVSLFDVGNPSKPALLSRVSLGQKYSWSEANYDEKALTVLQDQGLVLVPYNGDTTNGWANRVQLIDLSDTNLVARGLIEHEMQPRRTAFSHNRILSLSGWELLTVDATDRDAPAVRRELTLAFNVDQVLLAGNYLLQVSSSQSYYLQDARPIVRVSSADDPDTVLTELPLGTLPIGGAGISGGKLHLAQLLSPSYPPLDGNSNTVTFVHTVVNMDNLPALSIAGQGTAAVQMQGWGPGKWQPVFPKPGVVVWAGGEAFWAWPMLMINDGPIGGFGFRPWPLPGYGDGHFVTFDVTDPAAPKFASDLNLTTNNWWSFSQPFSFGTLVYLSHTAPGPLGDPKDPQQWVQRYYLDVIDFADPASPGLRNPVNLPGMLQGISNAGEMLYTVGNRWTTNEPYREWLDASAYDGTAAHLVASLQLSDSWPHPVAVYGPNVFVGNLQSATPLPTVTTNALETWTVTADGKFARTGALALEYPAETLWSGPDLLAMRDTNSRLLLLDPAIPGELSVLAKSQAPGCFWFDLTGATGNRTRGLYVPLGMYGVFHLAPGM